MITYTLEATDFNLIATFNFTQVLPQRPLKETNSDSEILLISSEPWVLLSWIEKKLLLIHRPQKRNETDYPPSCCRKAIGDETEARAREILKIANIKNDCLNYSERNEKTGPKKREEIVIWITKPERDTVRVNYIQ